MAENLFDRPRLDGKRSAAAILGLLLAIGLVGGAWQLGRSLLGFKQLDRSVQVKGLSEREVPANLAIWPITHVEAGNDVANLYRSIERNNARLVEFLKAAGFTAAELGTSPPTVVDKQAREYGGNDQSPFRYTGRATVTVYSTNVGKVRETMSRVGELGLVRLWRRRGREGPDVRARPARERGARAFARFRLRRRVADRARLPGGRLRGPDHRRGGGGARRGDAQEMRKRGQASFPPPPGGTPRRGNDA